MVLSASGQHGLAFLRRGTKAFIDNDPTVVELNIGKAVAVAKPSGGEDFIPSGSKREPQSFKIIGQANDSSGKSDSDGLTVVSRAMIMVGEHDSVAEVGDWWTDGGNRYTVKELLTANGYERKWSVTSEGLEPNYG